MISRMSSKVKVIGQSCYVEKRDCKIFRWVDQCRFTSIKTSLVQNTDKEGTTREGCQSSGIFIDTTKGKGLKAWIFGHHPHLFPQNPQNYTQNPQYPPNMLNKLNAPYPLNMYSIPECWQINANRCQWILLKNVLLRDISDKCLIFLSVLIGIYWDWAKNKGVLITRKTVESPTLVMVQLGFIGLRNFSKGRLIAHIINGLHL